MDTTDPAARLAAARSRLLEIWQDPQVRGYARRCAGDHDVADDALQNTYYVIARLKHLAEIENLKAYFYRVLGHEIGHELGNRREVLVEDFARVAEDQHSDTRATDETSAGLEDAACVSVQFWYLRRQLLAARDNLLDSVPARSADRGRYRTVIYATAEQILSAGVKGESSEADGVEALRAAYPEYLAQPGASANGLHQRLLRARGDVRSLLQRLAG